MSFTHLPQRASIVFGLLMLVSWPALYAPTHVAAAPETVKRVDYRATDAASKNRVRVVERYHWQPAMRCLNGPDTGGNRQCALNNLSFILNWVPNHPHALLKMSALQNRIGKAKSADQYMDSAVRYAPTDPAVYIVYGIHLQRSDRLSAAIEKYERAVELAPKYSEAHYNLGLAYLEKGKLDKANEHAQVAYGLGYRLPGLKEQLQARGAWKATEPPPSEDNASESTQGAAEPSSTAESVPE